MQDLPFSDFKWMTKTEINNFNVLKPQYLCTLVVDLHYPESIKERTKQFPLCPEKLVVEDKQLSSYQKSLLSAKKHQGITKLIINQNDKFQYQCDYRLPKYWLEMGMVLRKIHKGRKYK